MTTITRTSAETQVNVSPASSQYNPSVTGLADGGYVVVWFGNDGAVNSIKGRRYDASGASVGEFQVNDTAQSFVGAGSAPEIAAASDGGFVVGWTGSSFFDIDVRVRHFDAAGAPGAEVVGPDGGFNLEQNIQFPVAVTGLPGGRYVMAWTQRDPEGSNQYRINLQAYNSEGATIWGVQQVDAGFGAQQSLPVLATLADGGFITVWSTTTGEVRMQRFTVLSLPANQPVQQVNTSNNGDQSNADVVSLGADGFVVVWQSASQNDVGYDIRAQRFAADATRIGTEFRVNTTLDGTQYDASVTALSGGGFVVVWIDDSHFEDGRGIFAQRYAASGAAVGGEILVNATAVDGAAAPSVAALASDGFVVTWTGTDDDGQGIESRIFRAPQTFTGVASSAPEIIEGTRGADVIVVAPGSLGLGDAIYAGAGSDTLRLNTPGTVDLTAPSTFSGVEKIIGSAGSDIFVVSTARLAGVAAYVSNGGADVFVVKQGDFTLGADFAVAEIRPLSSAAVTNDDYLGNDYAQRITGAAGNNILRGYGGSDTLVGGLGRDFLYGGTGDDFYYVDTNSDAVREAADQGFDTVLTSATFSLVSSADIEVLRALNAAGTEPINLTGSDIAQTLIGNAGNNTLDGRAGADTMQGGAGDDAYIVDVAGDRVVEAANAGVDSIEASVSYSLAGIQVENLTLMGASGFSATGNSLRNILIGNKGANRIDGREGADTLQGGLGDDTYVVDTIGDRIVEAADAGYDSVESSVNFSLSGLQLERLTLTGSGAISGSGNGLANTIVGNEAANVIDGGGGADRLRGNGGADRFLFSSALGPDNVDEIVDFKHVDDVIALDDAAFAGLTSGMAFTAAMLRMAGGATVATTASQRVIYDTQSGALFYDRDGSGNTYAAVKFATLAGAPSFDHTDVIVV